MARGADQKKQTRFIGHSQNESVRRRASGQMAVLFLPCIPSLLDPLDVHLSVRPVMKQVVDRFHAVTGESHSGYERSGAPELRSLSRHQSTLDKGTSPRSMEHGGAFGMPANTPTHVRITHGTPTSA